MRNLFFFSKLFWLINLFVGIYYLSIIGSGQCLEDQRSLLLQLKQGLRIKFPSESKLSSWTSATDCCLWDGVTCDIYTRHVIGLDLSNCSISGGINSSSSLFSLHHLQKLNLAYNSFYPSPFPLDLGRLSSLTHLNLSHSEMKLGNPDDFQMLFRNVTNLRELHLDGVNISMVGSKWCQILSSALPNLRLLSLPECDLAGPIHPSLSQLQFLTHLNLDGNKLASRLPHFLANFSSLTSLHLSSCELYGTFPKKIFFMSTIRTIDVSYNLRLTGSLPKFPQSSSLEVIKLSYTNFTGTIPDSIDNLVFLRNLQLSQCNFFGSIPSSFENLPELTYLDLSSNNFSGSIPLLMTSKKVISLILSHNGFTGTIPSLYGVELKNLETLDLGNNSLQGSIPSSLFTTPSMKWLRLNSNRLIGHLQEIENASHSSLKMIDLSENELTGPIPLSIFKIQRLSSLALFSNRFHGTLETGMLKDLKDLGTLDLYNNNLTFIVTGSDSIISSKITKIRLSSCNINEFPNFLTNQINLFDLDLSNNRISGNVPNWVWELSLVNLNLSHNMLHGFEKPGPNLSSSHSLSVLDLHSNMLQGPFLVPPPSIVFLDYSNNKFKSTIPSDIGNHLYFSSFISLSSNNFHGEIPLSICETSYLMVLDLSNNNFNGSIPPCLALNGSLRILKLRNNKFQGTVPQIYGEGCNLRTLDLNQNHLEGSLPRSLVNCESLEVLDFGNNQINGSFPFWLEKLPHLRVLILRSNNFHGSIKQSQTYNAFPMLQIIDLSCNKFHGNLPSKWFQSWKGMMKQAKESQVLKFNFFELSSLYYQDSTTVMIKGTSRELVKILTIFTSIDLSNNEFKGELPEVVGDLESLYAFNMSWNQLTGQIPSSFGKLKELESFDLSQNMLSGAIPPQLTMITFLSVLNLSHNLLVGEIPRGNQFETFTAASFEGNIGLCGFPLSKTCRKTLVPAGLKNTSTEDSKSGWGIDWDFFWVGFGCGGGMGVVGGFLVGNVVINVVLRKRGIRAAHIYMRQL